MAKTRATEDIFDELHGMLADDMLALLRDYRAGKITDPKTGEVVTLPAAVIGQIAKFLKDNGIDRPAAKGDTLDLLDKELPEFDDEPNVEPIRRCEN